MGEAVESKPTETMLSRFTRADFWGLQREETEQKTQEKHETFSEQTRGRRLADYCVKEFDFRVRRSQSVCSLQSGKKKPKLKTEPFSLRRAVAG